MAGKSTLNAKNLEALGAAWLAELLITLSQGNAAAKRVLRLALPEQRGPTEIAKEVRKRLATISRSGSFLDGRQRDALLKDLDQQRRAIVGPIAEHEPALAVDLLWTFLELVEPVLERCDDSDGHVMPLFHQVTSDLGGVAARGKGNPEALADQVYGALIDNGFGQFDHLIAHLKEALRYRQPSDESRQLTVRLAMLDIADALEDAEAYLAEYRDHDPGALSVPSFAADVAERLMAAGRADEALTLLDAADPRETNRSAGLEEWLDARIGALERLDRGQEAQRLRWEHLERCLSIRHLCDYLQHLPDFEDAAEEARALGQVLDHPSFNRALRFLHQWPDRRRAAQLILRRLSELDGDCYELLGPVAESLEVEQPLAATLCLRAMIDFSLERARSTRYRHAARHLGTCRGLAPAIEDWGAMVDHRTYMARLRKEHGRKYGFCNLKTHDQLATAPIPVCIVLPSA